MRIMKVSTLVMAAVATTGLCVAGAAQAEKWDMPMAYSCLLYTSDAADE